MRKYDVVKVEPDLYLLRFNDFDTRYFEAMWDIPEGITYNSYVMIASEGAVLFDGWKHRYSEEFREALEKVVDLRDITKVVIHHMEPDHSGSLPPVLKTLGDKVEVIGHPLVARMLESFYGIKPKFRAMNFKEPSDLGGLKVKFIHTPWLHWPETTMTYVIDKGILFTGDAFGGYSVPKGFFDDDEEEVEKYLSFARKYFANVIGHYKEFVVKNIDMLRSLNLDIRILAPLHGLLWRKNPSRIINEYYKWAKGSNSGKVVVIYSSMYGFVEEAVNYLLSKLSEKGVKFRAFELTDRVRDSLSDILGEIPDAKALVVATATYEAEVFPAMKFVLQLILEKTRYRKPVILIASYGWGGVAGRKIEKMLADGGFEVLGKVEFRGRVREVELRKIDELVSKIM